MLVTHCIQFVQCEAGYKQTTSSNAQHAHCERLSLSLIRIGCDATFVLFALNPVAAGEFFLGGGRSWATRFK